MQPTRRYIDITPDNLRHCFQCSFDIWLQEIEVHQLTVELTPEDSDKLLRFLNRDEIRNYSISYTFDKFHDFIPFNFCLNISNVVRSIECLGSIFYRGRVRKLEILNVHIGPEGADVLARILSSVTIREFCLQSYNYVVMKLDGPRILAVMGMGLDKSRCLTVTGMGLDESRVLAALLPITRIQTLSLSDNLIRLPQIKILAEALSGTRIRALDLSRNGMGLDEIRILAKVLPDTRIRDLNLWGSMLGPDEVTVLSAVLSATKIQVLNLGMNNDIGSVGVMALAEVLPMTRIHTLDLYMALIESEGAMALVRALPKTRINTLKLGNNVIGSKAVAALAEVLHRTRIRNLHLPCLHVGDIGRNLKETMDRVIRAEELNRQGMYTGDGDRAVEALAKTLPMTGIQNLDISAFSDRLSSQGIMALARVLPMTRIQVLDISGYEIEADGLQALKMAVLRSRIQTLSIWSDHSREVPVDDRAIDLANEIEQSGIVLHAGLNSSKSELVLKRNQMFHAYLYSLRFQSVLKMFLMGMELGSASSLLLNVPPWCSLESATWAAEPGRIHFFSLPAKAPAQSAQSSAGRENVPGPSR